MFFQIVLKRDPWTEVRTEPWHLCTVPPLLSIHIKCIIGTVYWSWRSDERERDAEQSVCRAGRNRIKNLCFRTLILKLVNPLESLSPGYTKPTVSRRAASVRLVCLVCSTHRLSSAEVCPIQNQGCQDRLREWENWLDAQFSERVRAGELKRKWWKRVSKCRRHRQKAVLMLHDLSQTFQYVNIFLKTWAA